ncbi:MAG TPA: hypothetical protein VJ816_03060, partial [Gemmatimonadales bacterium]|nr:hypothetical protein [Gemmatimonadales bacterium]
AGALVVAVAPTAVERTRPAVDSVWRALSSRFGAGAAVVGQALIVIQYADQPEGEIPLEQSPTPPLYIPNRTAANEIVDLVMGWVSPTVFRSVDARLQEWVPHPYAFTSRGAASTLLRANRASLYAELATAPWHSARTCFRGAIRDCRAALGISGTDPVLDWLDAADRRHYVDSYLKYLPVPRTRYDRCASGDDDECIALTRLAPNQRPSPPLSVTARLLLLALALDAGGPDAFPRLLEHPDRSMDARLEAAAGLPIDSLVAGWRHDVLATHPKTVAADARAAWGAVVWSVLLAIAALRSTRWR